LFLIFSSFSFSFTDLRGCCDSITLLLVPFYCLSIFQTNNKRILIFCHSYIWSEALSVVCCVLSLRVLRVVRDVSNFNDEKIMSCFIVWKSAHERKRRLTQKNKGRIV
jgi:hypothetical protein